MNEQQYDHVRLQVDFLLRENRRLKRIGLAVATLMLVVMTAGAFRDIVPDVVKARSFLLVDEKGKEMASLSPLDGRPTLVFVDKNDKMKIALGLSGPDYPSLTFYDKKEGLRASISVGADDNSEVALFDKNHKRKVVLEAKQDSVAGLHLFDVKGEPNVFLSNDDAGPSSRPALMLGNNETKSLLSVGLEEKGQPGIHYSIGEKSYRGAWRIDPDNGSSFAIAGPDGRSGVIIRVAPDGSPSLNMTDKDGKVIFQIPKP